MLVTARGYNVLSGAGALVVLHELGFSVSHDLLVEATTIDETGASVASRSLTQLGPEVVVAERAWLDVARGDGGLLEHVSRITLDSSSIVVLLLSSA